MQSEVLLTLYIRHNLGSHLGDFFFPGNFIWKVLVSSFRKLRSGPIISWEIDGETLESVSDLLWGGPKSLQMVIAAMKLKDAYSLEGKL